MTHKLPRTASRDTSIENLVKNKTEMSVLLKIDNTTAIAYINNRGGNCIQGAGVPKDVLSRKEHLYPSTKSARDNGRGGRHGMEIYEGSIGLEIRLINIFEDQQDLWSTGIGPVCIQTDQSVSLLLQLAARSICRGNRCLPPGLDISERPHWNLMKAQCKGADIILVAPVWISQPWYFLLVSMLVDWPCLLPKQDTITESVPIVPCGASQGKSQQTRPFKSGCRPYPQIMEDENKRVL